MLDKERATHEKEQQEAMLARAYGSGAPAHTEGATPTTMVSDVLTTLLSSEQAFSYKVSIANQKNGA